MSWWSAVIHRVSDRRMSGVQPAQGDVEARDAISRARRSQVEARSQLTEMRALTNEIHRERVRNHLAKDIYDSMRRRRA